MQQESGGSLGLQTSLEESPPTHYMAIYKIIHVYYLGSVWIEGGRKGSRVEMAENMLILGQIYSTLLYSPSLSLNPNGLLNKSNDSFKKSWKSLKVYVNSLFNLLCSGLEEVS